MTTYMVGRHNATKVTRSAHDICMSVYVTGGRGGAVQRVHILSVCLSQVVTKSHSTTLNNKAVETQRLYRIILSI